MVLLGHVSDSVVLLFGRSLDFEGKFADKLDELRRKELQHVDAWDLRDR